MIANTKKHFTVVNVFSGIYTSWQTHYLSEQLSRKLCQLTSMLDEWSPDLLANDYLDVYNTYLKLSEEKKRNFYPTIVRLREKIERILMSEKKFKQLCTHLNRGDVDEQKNIYLEMHKHYQMLPKAVQQKYYAYLVQMRDRLERGL